MDTLILIFLANKYDPASLFSVLSVEIIMLIRKHWGLKILSWNILAQEFVTRDKDKYYVDIPDFALNRDFRFQLIHNQIEKINADICCFQEVELKYVETDFSKWFTKYDYRYHQINKKRTNTIGNFVMWKRNYLHLVEPETLSSCAVITNLVCVNLDFNFVLCNVHLKAGLRSGEPTRINQIKSCVEKIRAVTVCICGDFNDMLVTDSVLRKKIESENFVVSGPQQTFYSYKENVFYSFDQICTRNLNVKANRIMDLRPIPSEIHPLDHFPLIFSIYLI